MAETLVEKGVVVSRVLDVGTVAFALVVGGPLAVVLLEGAVFTGAIGEIVDSAVKRSKKD